MDPRESFALRRLEIRDVPACERILRALPHWFGIEEANRAYVESLGRLPGAVAEAGGEIVGFIALEAHDPKSLEIHVLCVEPGRHRRGVGRELVRWSRDFALARGAHWLHVKTRGPAPGAPALLNRQSSRPNDPSAVSTSAAMSASRVTSARWNTARGPRSRASASPFTTVRPASTTWAPSAAKRRAVASPMPLVAPVMIATLPSSRPAMLRAFYRPAGSTRMTRISAEFYGPHSVSDSNSGSKPCGR